MNSLFAGSPVSPEDEDAAQALALAFLDSNGGGGSAGIEGAPAHPAANELSLDTVFGGAGSGPSNVSYDQFFARDASTQHATSGAAGAHAPDDVAHFTQWLEGLKQR
jgi:hypothetical protein